MLELIKNEKLILLVILFCELFMPAMVLISGQDVFDMTSWGMVFTFAGGAIIPLLLIAVCLSLSLLFLSKRLIIKLVASILLIFPSYYLYLYALIFWNNFIYFF